MLFITSPTKISTRPEFPQHHHHRLLGLSCLRSEFPSQVDSCHHLSPSSSRHRSCRLRKPATKGFSRPWTQHTMVPSRHDGLAHGCKYFVLTVSQRVTDGQGHNRLTRSGVEHSARARYGIVSNITFRPAYYIS